MYFTCNGTDYNIDELNPDDIFVIRHIKFDRGDELAVVCVYAEGYSINGDDDNDLDDDEYVVIHENSAGGVTSWSYSVGYSDDDNDNDIEDALNLFLKLAEVLKVKPR